MRFSDITAQRPTREGLAADYAELFAMLDHAAVPKAIQQWERLRREIDTWFSLTQLHFSQDTTNAVYQAEREYADQLGPVVADFETKMKRRLLDAHAPESDHALPPHLKGLWRVDITTFDPTIAADLEAEAGLESRYTQLLASARIPFQGREFNLAGLQPFLQNPDRHTRHDAASVMWKFFQTHADELDDLYDRLVKLRSKMAQVLGDAVFTSLGYRRMRRTDYGPAEVETYRKAVLQHVTPLVARLMEQRKRENQLDELYAWDEPMIDPAGNPVPAGDQHYLTEAAQGMFDRIHPLLADLYRLMQAGGFMDLDNRPGKAGGGFCTSFPKVGMPFIFANFNGTHHDIDVFTHEMGHAFQNYQSRFQPISDYFWPTMDAAEIHSMSLEFLAYPEISRLMGDHADRYRKMHLKAALEFLPYGVCVDHFQHEVYDHPDMSPADRNRTWHRLENLYMPWRKWGDLDYPASGARWQAQSHIYRSPFYYIDYTLAQCVALQFWRLSQLDYASAVQQYVDLCSQGGSAPFLRLLSSAGLKSPFNAGALEGVVHAAAEYLNVSGC